MTNPSRNKVIIVGGFHELIESCEAAGLEIVGLIDSKLRGAYCGYPVLGSDSEAGQILAAHPVPILICPDQPQVRKRLFEEYRNAGAGFLRLVHPRAQVSGSAELGEGVVVQAFGHVSASARLGSFVRVNVAANIMHDVTVGDFSTIAPNAVLLGGVRIGAGVYIGSNSTILPGINVGDYAVVGAGATVTRDVPAGITVVGNPATALRRS